MLLPLHRLINQPVMSLQTGGELARITDLIIDPRQLVIVALYVEGKRLGIDPAILHVADIRELSSIGCIIDDSNVIMALEGLVRLQLIIDFNFTLLGTPVFDERGKSLGKVEDAAFEPTTYTIQQIQTKPSLLHSFGQTSYVIHRRQIISVTSERIVVESADVAELASADAKAEGFINPFRRPVEEHSIRTKI